MSWQHLCNACGRVPVAFTTVDFCFECWPGGPTATPPCLECGSTIEYFTNGLCGRCHRMGPAGIDTCTDCFAWGATRHRAWRCTACGGWRDKRPMGVCVCCDREMPVNRLGGCRLCTKQRTRVLATKPALPLPDLIESSRHGQQLWFADMGKALAACRPKTLPKPAVVGALTNYPVGYRQLPLFGHARDMRIAHRLGHPDPKDPNLAALIDGHVDDYGHVHGWDRRRVVTVKRGIHVLLGEQETVGAPIRYSDILAIVNLKISTLSVADVLDTIGMLDDDRTPAVHAWFARQIETLPADMAAELTVWFDIMRHGNKKPPRRKPRQDSSIYQQLNSSLPAITDWATTRTSLREVARDDIYAALPPSGYRRNHMLQGLRSIFRVLKGAKLIFVNPTTHLRQLPVHHTIPTAVDIDALRTAFNSPDPACALTAALLGFHAIRVKDLRALKLTDIHDGRLHLGDQTIVLAQQVRDRFNDYLFHRAATWPHTINPHLFINVRSATHTRPVNQHWHSTTLGMPAQSIRQDRILDEAFATRGDLRQISELFGLSVAQSNIYANHAHHAMLSDTAGDPE